MVARVFSNPVSALDVWFVAPVFDPGASAGGLAPVAGAVPRDLDTVDTIIVTAEALTNRLLWGEMSGRAAALMAAHLLWIEAAASTESPIDVTGPAGGYAGVVTSESVGPVSRSYGAKASGFVAGGDGAFANDPLAQSPYGKQLIVMRRSINARGMF